MTWRPARRAGRAGPQRATSAAASAAPLDPEAVAVALRIGARRTFLTHLHTTCRTRSSSHNCRRASCRRTTGWSSTYTSHKMLRRGGLDMTADVQTTLKQYRDPKVRQECGAGAARPRRGVWPPRSRTGPLADLEIGQTPACVPRRSRALPRARRGEVPPVHDPAMNVPSCRTIPARHLPGGEAAGRRRVHLARFFRAPARFAYTDQRPAEYVAVMTARRCAKASPGPSSSRATTSR